MPTSFTNGAPRASPLKTWSSKGNPPATEIHVVIEGTAGLSAEGKEQLLKQLGLKFDVSTRPIGNRTEVIYRSEQGVAEEDVAKIVAALANGDWEELKRGRSIEVNSGGYECAELEMGLKVTPVPSQTIGGEVDLEVCRAEMQNVVSSG